MTIARRKILLINPRFQLRFALYICTWIFAFTLIYPAIIYSLFDFFLEAAKTGKLQTNPDAVLRMRGSLIWLLIVLQSVFIIITFILSLFVSHRIAGPLYKVRSFFKNAVGMKLSKNMNFRKYDYFKELAEEYNDMTKRFEQERSKEVELIETVLARLEAANSQATRETEHLLSQAVTELKTLKERISI